MHTHQLHLPSVYPLLHQRTISKQQMLAHLQPLYTCLSSTQLLRQLNTEYSNNNNNNNLIFYEHMSPSSDICRVDVVYIAEQLTYWDAVGCFTPPRVQVFFCF